MIGLEAGHQARPVLQILGLLLALIGTTHATASGAAVDAASVTLAEIDRLVEPAHCTADGQCRVADIGVRPCGGAESHRAWSTLGTDVKALQRQLRNYADQRRLQHETEGLLSTCEILPTPRTRCEQTGTKAGRCVLQRAVDGVR